MQFARQQAGVKAQRVEQIARSLGWKEEDDEGVQAALPNLFASGVSYAGPPKGGMTYSANSLQR